MKYLIILLISFNSFAGGFFALEKYGSLPESYKLHEFKDQCEKEENSPCYDVDACKVEECSLADNIVLDYVAKLDEVSCESEKDCDDKFLALVCTDSVAIKNYDLLQVYCAKEIMKVDGKKLVVDEAKKAAIEAAKKAREKMVRARKELRELRRAELQAIDWSASMTVAQLKALLKKAIEAQSE